MKINEIPVIEITDFENQIGHEIVVKERAFHTHLKRYYLGFDGAEIRSDLGLVTSCGDGNTIDGALQDYCNIISHKTLVFNARSPRRTEVNVPKLIHTKMLGK